jgi:hypothetical protein
MRSCHDRSKGGAWPAEGISINDQLRLNEIARIIDADPRMKPTTAIKALGITDRRRSGVYGTNSIPFSRSRSVLRKHPYRPRRLPRAQRRAPPP